MADRLYFNGPNSEFNHDANITTFISSDSTRPIWPSQATNVTVATRMRTVQFGDGYSQRVLEAVNIHPRIYNVIFKNRRAEIVKALTDFFKGTNPPYDSREPNDYFYWIPPAPYDTLGKFIVGDWKLQHEQSTISSITATFSEVFDP